MTPEGVALASVMLPLERLAAMFGESHASTLDRFQVAANEVRDALRLRFADYFQRDPKAQATFLEAMQQAILRVRAERDRT